MRAGLEKKRVNLPLCLVPFSPLLSFYITLFFSTRVFAFLSNPLPSQQTFSSYIPYILIYSQAPDALALFFFVQICLSSLQQTTSSPRLSVNCFRLQIKSTPQMPRRNHPSPSSTLRDCRHRIRTLLPDERFRDGEGRLNSPIAKEAWSGSHIRRVAKRHAGRKPAVPDKMFGLTVKGPFVSRGGTPESRKKIGAYFVQASLDVQTLYLI